MLFTPCALYPPVCPVPLTYGWTYPPLTPRLVLLLFPIPTLLPVPSYLPWFPYLPCCPRSSAPTCPHTDPHLLPFICLLPVPDRQVSDPIWTFTGLLYLVQDYPNPLTPDLPTQFITRQAEDGTTDGQGFVENSVHLPLITPLLQLPLGSLFRWVGWLFLPRCLPFYYCSIP